MRYLKCFLLAALIFVIGLVVFWWGVMVGQANVMAAPARCEAMQVYRSAQATDYEWLVKSGFARDERLVTQMRDLDAKNGRIIGFQIERVVSTGATAISCP